MSDWRVTLSDLVLLRGGTLKRYAYLLCGDPQDADDLVQTALMKVLARRRSDDLRSAEAYVKRAIANEYIDRTRAHRTWLQHVLRLSSSTEAEDWTTDAARASEVRDCLETLSPRQRACVVLRFYEDMTVPEVARTLGCRPGTVKRHLSDSMVRLREELSHTI